MCRVTVLLVAVVTGAFGQYANPRATVFAGGSFIASDRIFLVGDDPFQSEFDKGGRVGARATVDLTDRLAAEVSYAFSRNDLRIRELDEGLAPERFEVRLHQVTGGVLYYFEEPDEDLRPFVDVGIGLTRFSPTDDAQVRAVTRGFLDRPAAISASNRFSFHFGGGIEARVNRWFGIRIDVRDHVMAIPRFGLPRRPEPGQPAFYPVNGRVHNIEASVGGVFYFR